MKPDWSIDDVLNSILEDTEGLSDTDTFSNESFWNKTFGEILDEGGVEFLTSVLALGAAKADEVNVEQRYIVANVPSWGSQTENPTTSPRYKIKIPFELNTQIIDWYYHALLPEWRKIHSTDLNPKDHPLFYEALSPWGNEMGKPWGWQASVTSISEIGPSQGTELSDTDEFMTGTDKWLVVITNKNIPNKELSGIVGWHSESQGGWYPQVQKTERNDFNLSKDFAEKLLWAVYWAAEETSEGRNSSDLFEIDQGNLVQIDDSGIELLKYLNDPEHYGSFKYPSKPKGWGNVGTHTYGEALEPAVVINGKTFVPLLIGSFMNLLAHGWFWAPNAQISKWTPDEIMDAYQEMFIWRGEPFNIEDYLESNTPTMSTDSSLGDQDEFEFDDPEIDLQRWEDAEHLAANDIREKLLNDFTTVDNPELEVLFVGATSARSSGQDYNHEEGAKPRLYPYVIVGRKNTPVTESLDDKDEFRSADLIPYDTIITYIPVQHVGSALRGINSVSAIEIARQIASDNGFETGTFDYTDMRRDGNQVRIYGKLDIDENFADHVIAAGGYMELEGQEGVTLIIQIESEMVRRLGLDV